jgi:hypothetical protein
MDGRIKGRSYGIRMPEGASHTAGMALIAGIAVIFKASLNSKLNSTVNAGLPSISMR